MKNFRVFIEYIHSSKRDLTAPKGWWDIISVPNGWRHARLIVTTKDVPFISSDVEGNVYDAGKNDNSKLVPMYEKFKPTSYNRYLPIGTLKAGINDGEIKTLLEEFVTKYPNYNLMDNNCESLAKALSRQIIDGLYPTQVKERAAVYATALGAMAENFVKITMENGFEDAAILDLGASLSKGSGPFDIDNIIKEKE